MTGTPTLAPVPISALPIALALDAPNSIPVLIGGTTYQMSLQTLLDAVNAGIYPITEWDYDTDYAQGQLVFVGDTIYRSADNHTSIAEIDGGFDDDLLAGHWTVVTVMPTGAVDASQVAAYLGQAAYSAKAARVAESSSWSHRNAATGFVTLAQNSAKRARQAAEAVSTLYASVMGAAQLVYGYMHKAQLAKVAAEDARDDAIAAAGVFSMDQVILHSRVFDK